MQMDSGNRPISEVGNTAEFVWESHVSPGM